MIGACTFADSHLRTIFAYEFDIDSGTIGMRHEFASLDSIPGVPDGSSVDSEGFLWNAVFDGGCLVRYAPDGRTDRVVPLPVSRPSACTFGGPDLATLYVTTARFRLPPEKLATEPYAGGLLAHRCRSKRATRTVLRRLAKPGRENGAM